MASARVAPCAQALEHRFFHGMPELPRGSQPLVPRTSDFEDLNLSPHQLRQLIRDEINSYQRYEVQMSRRPSYISDGRGPSLRALGQGGTIPVPAAASAVGESDEGHSRGSEPAGVDRGASSAHQTSDRSAAAASATAASPTAAAAAKRPRTRHCDLPASSSGAAGASAGASAPVRAARAEGRAAAGRAETTPPHAASAAPGCAAARDDSLDAGADAGLAGAAAPGGKRRRAAPSHEAACPG